MASPYVERALERAKSETEQQARERIERERRERERRGDEVVNNRYVALYGCPKVFG
jgi:dephospho-CoA kinase